MVAYLGLPSVQYVQRSKVQTMFSTMKVSLLHLSIVFCLPTSMLLNLCSQEMLAPFVKRINLVLSKWKGAGGVDIPPISLEGSEENLEGEIKELFLRYMISMMHWVPEEGKLTKELLDDPWLNEKIKRFSRPSMAHLQVVSSYGLATGNMISADRILFRLPATVSVNYYSSQEVGNEKRNEWGATD